MINFIEGKLSEVSPAHAVIECNGIGYLLHITLTTYSRINKLSACKLLTHLAVNPNDYSLSLFGFFEEKERSLFRNLISVSGIGVSTARVILSSRSPDELQQAILTGNAGMMTGIKGIGEKTAQRIIIDLKGKLEKEGVSPSVSPLSQHNTFRNEALSVLSALGFSKNTAEKAVDLVIRRDGADTTVEKLVKEAMKIM